MSRKRKFQSSMESAEIEILYRKKRKNHQRLKLQEAPSVNSIKDLIELGKSIRYYKNLDTVMLWRITPYLEELQSLIGMDSVKESIFYQVIYYLQGMHKRNNEEYLHTVIYGSPGTGKTTVSKIIGNLYKAMGVLSSDGTFTVAHRDDFIAGFLGQTATKTKKLLKSCLGGVLFIDEAYSLAPRDNDRDSFSKEAIDTITGFLSEHKNDFCCIIAGYEDEVQNCFFGMNQGLKRRFPWVHRIPDYSKQELYQIFLRMTKDMNWTVNAEEKDIINIFDKHKELFKHAGGDIETYISKCKMVHAKRVFSLSNDLKFILTKEDLKEALKFVKKNENKEESKTPMGMYT